MNLVYLLQSPGFGKISSEILRNILDHIVLMYRAYYRGVLKTDLVHKGILPEIQKFAVEEQCRYDY